MRILKCGRGLSVAYGQGQRLVSYINSQILLQPKRICYVLLNTDTEERRFLWQTHTPADEFFWGLSNSFSFLYFPSYLISQHWPLRQVILSLYSSHFYSPIQIFPYIFQTLISTFYVSQNISPWFFLPISIFYPFFFLPLFLSSFIILQNTTIYFLSSALDAFQSDFLFSHWHHSH